MKEYLDNEGCIVLAVFNHKQVIINSFKHCALTIATDGSEDLLIYYLKKGLSQAAPLRQSRNKF